jgi:hypothetical protein
MKLFNLTQNTLITDNLIIANSLIDKTVGLIGKEKNEASSLYFQTRWGIHTFGMKFPITVIVCDNNFIVKKIIKNLQSNSFFFWNPKYKNIFELILKNFVVNLDDKIVIE